MKIHYCDVPARNGSQCNGVARRCLGERWLCERHKILFISELIRQGWTLESNGRTLPPHDKPSYMNTVRDDASSTDANGGNYLGNCDGYTGPCDDAVAQIVVISEEGTLIPFLFCMSCSEAYLSDVAQRKREQSEDE